MSRLRRAFEILKKEKVEYDKKVVWDLIEDSYPDFRGVVLTLQRAKKTYGIIDERVLGFLGDAVLSSLVEAMKKMKFNDIRKIASGMDPGAFYSSFYSQIDTLIKNEGKPDVIVLLAEYCYRDGVSVNKEINLVAALVELMKMIKWKE